jgi:hypothetical protein
VYAYHGAAARTDGLKSRPRVWEIDHGVDQAARQIARRIERARNLRAGAEGPRVHFGPVASGEVLHDARVSQPLRWIREHYDDALAIEMEAAGVAKAGQLSAAPVAVIRAISDRADGSKADTDGQRWQPRAVRNAATFAIALAADLIRRAPEAGRAGPGSAGDPGQYHRRQPRRGGRGHQRRGCTTAYARPAGDPRNGAGGERRQRRHDRHGGRREPRRGGRHHPRGSAQRLLPGAPGRLAGGEARHRPGLSHLGAGDHGAQPVERGHRRRPGLQRGWFTWLLAFLSGRTLWELSAEDRQCWTAALRQIDGLPRDSWSPGIDVILRVVAASRSRTEDRVAASEIRREIDDLDAAMGTEILRHLERVLQGALKDELWHLDVEQARIGRLDERRQERVWKFFEPDPAHPRTRPVRPSDVPAGSVGFAVVMSAVRRRRRRDPRVAGPPA